MVTCHKSSSSSDKIIMTKQNCSSKSPPNPPPPPPPARAPAKTQPIANNNNHNDDDERDRFSRTPVAKRDDADCYSPPMPPPPPSTSSKAKARSKKSPTTTTTTTTSSNSATTSNSGSSKKSHKRQKHYEEIVKEIKRIMAKNPRTRRKLRYLARKQRVQETVPTLSFAEEVLASSSATCPTPEHDDDKLLLLLQQEDSPPIIRLPALTADKIKTSVNRKPTIEEKKPPPQQLNLLTEKPTMTTTTTTAPLLNFVADTDRLVLESRSPSPALPLLREDEDTFIKEDMTKHQLLLMKNIKSLEKTQAAAAAVVGDLRPKFTGNFKFTDRFLANEQPPPQQHLLNNLTTRSKPLITLPNFSTLNSSIVNAATALQAKEESKKNTNDYCAYPLHLMGPRIQSKLFPQTMQESMTAAATVAVEGPLPERASVKTTTTSSLSRLLEIKSPAKQQQHPIPTRSPLLSPRDRSRSRSRSREAAVPLRATSPCRDSLNSPRQRSNCNAHDHELDDDDDDDDDDERDDYDRERGSLSTRSSSASCSDRSSRSRSSTRSSRSPSIPRRYGSPSFLDRRRITSARKRPIPYHRPTPSPSSSVDSSHSDDSSPSSSHSDDAWSQKSYKSI